MISSAQVLLSSILTWAAFSFLSNSALALHHLLLLIAGLLIIREKKRISFPKSSLCIFILIGLGMLSVVLNYSELQVPLKKIFRLKYFFFAAMLWALVKVYREYLRPYRGLILSVFLTSFSISVAYGFYHWGITGDRPTGFFGMVMSYAYTAQFPILLILFLALNPKISLAGPKRIFSWLDQPLVRWSLLLIFLVNLYFVQARGPVVGLLISFPLLILGRRKLLIPCAIGGMCLVGFFVWSAFSGAVKSDNRLFLSANSTPNTDRISQYQMAWFAFKKAPLFGVGWRSLDERSSGIKKEHGLPFSDDASHAHNIFLEVLATTGIFGFLAFLGWIFFWVYESFVLNESHWRYFYLAAIAAFLISGLFQSVIIDSEYEFTLFAFYGLTPLFTRYALRPKV